MWGHMPREVRRRRKHHIGWPALADGLIVLTACGATSSSTQSSTSAAFPVTITETSGATVTIPKQPHQIVSLSPTATEMLFAINAGHQLIAVDDQSNYPDDGPIPELSVLQPDNGAITV